VKAVWKFHVPLTPNGRFELKMPKGAEILSLQLQGSDPEPFIWALVDPHNGDAERLFQIVGTGHEEVTKYHHYIGTYQEGRFVWHVFEITYPEQTS
jgi:hypothetical protein